MSRLYTGGALGSAPIAVPSSLGLCGEDGVCCWQVSFPQLTMIFSTMEYTQAFSVTRALLTAWDPVVTSAESLETDVPKEGRKRRAHFMLFVQKPLGLESHSLIFHSCTHLCGTQNTVLGS